MAACLVAASMSAMFVGAAEAQDAEATPTAVSEETRPEVPQITRIGVVLLPRGATDPSVTDSLTELLIARVASRGAMEIVGKEEFQAALGRDDAGTLDCIESDACLGRMGRELRVSELITGTIHVDVADADRIRFELYRLDVESGSARGHVSHEIVGGFSALLAALNTSVDELFVERLDPGAVVLTMTPSDAVVTLDEFPVMGSNGHFRSDFLSPGDHALVARAGGHRLLQRVIRVEPGTTLMLDIALTPRSSTASLSPLSWTLGTTGFVALGLAIGLGVASTARPELRPGQLQFTMSETTGYFNARADEALAANLLYGVSAALFIGTVISAVIDLSAEEPEWVARALRGEVATW
jgi:hypothetical protein